MAIKYFKEQFDNEEVLLVFRRHPVVMRRGLVYGSFGLLIGVIPAAIKPDLGMTIFFLGLLGGFILACLIMLPYWVKWYFSTFIMTDKRFIQQTRSFFHESVVDIGLEQIQMINYEIKGVQETLLGFGTIMVQTFVGDLVIHDVHHPAKLQKEMVEKLRELGVHASSRPGTSDVEDYENAGEEG